jgi:hypothetical protein
MKKLSNAKMMMMEELVLVYGIIRHPEHPQRCISISFNFLTSVVST